MDKFGPSEANLGENCLFFNFEEAPLRGCDYPKAEIMGRLSCEGVIDDVCLHILKIQKAESLTTEQALEIKTSIPTINRNKKLPPGN